MSIQKLSLYIVSHKFSIGIFSLKILLLEMDIYRKGEGMEKKKGPSWNNNLEKN